MRLIDGSLPQQLPGLTVKALCVQLSLLESRKENVLPRKNGRGLALPHGRSPGNVLVLAEYCGKALVCRYTRSIRSAKTAPAFAGGLAGLCVGPQAYQTKERPKQFTHSAI